MPTLIRLIVFLGVLAGLGYAGMFALALFVDPGVKEISVRIPARDFAGNAQGRPAGQTAPRPLVTSEPEPAVDATGTGDASTEVDTPE